MATAEDLQKKSEMNDQLREYISQWRDERSKEEAELKRLKDKQAARKEIRAEQEEAGSTEEGRGGEDQEGGAGEEGSRGPGQEEADGGGREEKAGDARCPERGR